MRLAHHTSGCCLALCLLSLWPATLWAQQAPTPATKPAATPAEAVPAPAINAAYQEALQRGNAAYNAGDYKAAILSYVQAAQAEPLEAEPYRNMARAYFWQADYDASLAYYDIYLVNFPAAKDAEQIQRERRLTSERSRQPWSLPEPQRQAMRALEDRIDAAPAYSRGGGGAWKAYQQLLRSGYAHPGLMKLRQRLFVALLAEFDKLVTPPAGQPAPALDLATWELQRARLEAAQKITGSAEHRTAVMAREPMVEAALAMQLSRYDDAVSHSLLAVERNPKLISLQWLLISALMRANRSQEALTTLDALEPMLQQHDPAQLAYHHVVRAMILQRLGRPDDAADIYVGIFKGQ